MELEAKKRHIPFLTAMANIKTRWDLYIEIDDFLELAYPIWRSIGNIATEDHTLEAIVPADGIIQLPDGCEFVEGVTTTEFRNIDGADIWSLNRRTDSSGSNPHINVDKKRASPSTAAGLPEDYTNGDFVNWTLGDGFLRVTSKELVDLKVTIKYTAIDVDSDGLPLLNDKELDALTYNVALRDSEKALFRKIPGSIQLVEYLKPEATRTLAAAKVPEKISSDVLDRAMDIKVSRDFKTFGTRMNFR